MVEIGYSMKKSRNSWIHVFLVMAMTMFPVGLMAQAETHDGVKRQAAEKSAEDMDGARPGATPGSDVPFQPQPFAEGRAVMPSFLDGLGGEPSDSLHLPVLGMRGEVLPVTLQPLYWGGWNSWSLHRGLNVSLGASVFAEFGKNARGGAGFAQNISAMYAMPVTKKLSVAVGGYFNNVMWQHDAWREAGLSAVVGYKFNDHWEAYLYGQKSLAGNRRFMPCTVWDISNIGDRIGAAVKYNVNRNFSFQVSVEQGWTPDRFRPRASFGPDGFQPEW